MILPLRKTTLQRAVTRSLDSMTDNTRKTFQTVLEEYYAMRTPLSTMRMRPRPASLAKLRDFTKASAPAKAMAHDTFSLVFPVIGAVLAGLVAWVFLGLAITYLIVPYQGRRRQPSLRSRLEFTYWPTFILSTIQLCLALIHSQMPTSETYEVKITGKQEVREVSPVPKLAYDSWLLTVGVMMVVLGAFVVLEHIGRCETDANNQVREQNLPPLCP